MRHRGLITRYTYFAELNCFQFQVAVPHWECKLPLYVDVVAQNMAPKHGPLAPSHTRTLRRQSKTPTTPLRWCGSQAGRSWHQIIRGKHTWQLSARSFLLASGRDTNQRRKAIDRHFVHHRWQPWHIPWHGEGTSSQGSRGSPQAKGNNNWFLTPESQTCTSQKRGDTFSKKPRPAVLRLPSPA